MWDPNILPSHLARAGHVGRLVISSEEAIAKGIRRVIALTGPEAERALNRAQHLKNTVAAYAAKITHTDTANNRLTQKHLLKDYAQLDKDVCQSLISHWERDAIRQELLKLKKVLDGYDKQYRQHIADKVLSEAKSLCESGEGDGGKRLVVHQFMSGASAKALDAASKQIKCAGSALFSADPDTNKVLCLVTVDKACLKTGLNAKDWIGEISKVIGGKGGGKDTNAQAVGDRPQAISEALLVAKKFAEIKLG